MITVTNRIQVKKGFGMKMAPAFIKNEGLFEFDGFEKVEVNVSTQHEDYDEMQVMMYWNSKEQFDVWRNSDDFKNSHKRDGGGEGESPVIKSELIVAEVAAVLSK
ncbi:heme oxygenase [Planococcus beigongshangi]|uniref:heme oxygenase n=1 Tax=Planococcus beigongshangi TaxID=2782536 RepID=UPI00193B3CD8|nr:heme oxygenase [Planococcus beigongshangi]